VHDWKELSSLSANLWITLCETCAHTLQVLDSATFQGLCHISWHGANINKINDLARIVVILNRSAGGMPPDCAAARKLGISQDLSVH
jgi:hypothetical protein